MWHVACPGIRQSTGAVIWVAAWNSAIRERYQREQWDLIRLRSRCAVVATKANWMRAIQRGHNYRANRRICLRRAEHEKWNNGRIIFDSLCRWVVIGKANETERLLLELSATQLSAAVINGVSPCPRPWMLPHNLPNPLPEGWRATGWEWGPIKQIRTPCVAVDIVGMPRLPQRPGEIIKKRICPATYLMKCF